MPARLDLTPDEMVERVRRQTNDRVRRHRERQRNASVTLLGNVTDPTSGAPAPTYADARSTAFFVTPSLSEKEERTTDFEQVWCVLEPLRGYAHDERLLARLAATFPDVDLVLEAIGMAEWLNRPANRKRACSKGFIANWVKRVHSGRVAESTRPQPLRPEPRSALGRVLEQIATSPVEGPSTWGRR
jgi:hypothetical protein